MEIRHLKYFLALAEEQNFTRAAKRLHISQPPLTRQIHQLEEELGTQLFLRTGKGVTLTQAGQSLMVETANILGLLSRSKERAQMAGRGELGKIDIGVFGSAMLNVIPRLLLNFRNLFPEVDIALYNMSRTQQIEALREQRIHIGFNRIIPAEIDITVETVLNERLVVAVYQVHPLASRQEIHARDLVGQPIILYPRAPRSGLHDLVINLIRNEGAEPKIVQEVEDLVSSVALVSAGLGLCVTPESAISLKLPGVVYVPLIASIIPYIELNCMYLKGERAPILNSFLSVVHAFQALEKLNSGNQA